MRAALVESRRADSFTVRRDRERGVRGRAARAALRRRRAETRICRGGREESHTYGTERERATGAPAMTRRSVLQALRQWTRLDPSWWREVCAYYGVTRRRAVTLGRRQRGRRPAFPGGPSGLTYEEIWARAPRETAEQIAAFYRDLGPWPGVRLRAGPAAPLRGLARRGPRSAAGRHATRIRVRDRARDGVARAAPSGLPCGPRGRAGARTRLRGLEAPEPPRRPRGARRRVPHAEPPVPGPGDRRPLCCGGP